MLQKFEELTMDVFLDWNGKVVFVQERMVAARHAAYHGPSILKEIFYGITLGLAAGGLWKMHHWNNKKRTKEFYDLLEKGVTTVVVGDE